MSTAISAERWQTVLESLQLAGEQFSDLLARVQEPDRIAVGTWSVSQTAAHVAAVASIYTTLLAATTQADPIPGIKDRVHTAALNEVGALNEFALRHVTDRDPRILGRQIRDSVSHLLTVSERLDPARRLGWLGNAQLPICGWYAHLLNEIRLHGHDIAEATGAPWELPQRDAAAAFEMFLVNLLAGDTGRLLTHEPIAHTKIAISFRSRYTTPVVLAVQDGRITVQPPNSSVEATLFFQPAALMLVLFNRLGKVRAALSGRVVVWGRRPWLVPAFLRSVRFP